MKKVKGGTILIELTKLNGEPILINVYQIEYIELIPEAKIMMMNGKFHLVKEDKDVIKERVVEFLRSTRIENAWED
ncbi:flagellar FlbD family protein [Zhenpiania hominis]|uniref:flagellar FlbD family protein n=1 Tax=Zhenpiania hominis TaxID=2763644 RepID=UPI001FACCE04|nr:flagellar FlbD family protein [Zhenpiania hominis]